VPEDHLVDVGLRELLGLDLVLLARAQEVVEERDVSLSTSMNSMMPRLATLNSPSKLNARGSLSVPSSAIFR
jgi:hypothetical protein